MNRTLLSQVTTIALSTILTTTLFTSCEDDIEIPEVTIDDIWTSGIAIEWPASSGELQVQISVSEGFTTFDVDTTVTQGSVEVDGLASATDYFVRYRYLTSDGNSDFSAPMSFSTLELAVPQNIFVGKVVGDEIHLSWDEVRGASYEIHVSETSNFQIFDTVIPKPTLATNVVIEPLEPETTYYIRIKSTNHDQDSDYSVLEPISTTDQLEFTLRSLDFEADGSIPASFSCLSPPPQLYWKNMPEGAVTLAVTMIDLDFQTDYNHWILYNMSPQLSGISQGSTGNKIPSGSVEGTNDNGNIGYFGPCPPAGQSHRYWFTLYALDTQLNRNESIRYDAFLTAIESHVISTAILRGNYE